MKTSITKTAQNEVTLNAIDPITDEAVSWVFWVPTNGGYVRIGAGLTADDRQVCKALDTMGQTLTATDGDELLSVIRTEWKAYRKSAVEA